MKRFLLSALCISLLSTAASAEDRFNLTCKGKKTINNVAQPGTVTTTLRIDLVGRRYCRDDCRLVDPIKSFWDEKIELHQSELDRQDIGLTLKRHVSIDRVAGKLRDVEIHRESSPYRNDTTIIEADCVPSAFEPFPRPKF